MNTINLTNLDTSYIKYKVSKFPDGQQDINIISHEIFGSFEPKYRICGYSLSDLKGQIIEISSRFNSFKDLELIIATTKALRRLEVKSIHLYIPYLLGARSDRQFIDGGTSYLVDVVAPIINAQGFETVTVLDVHSDVAPACINNLKLVDNSQLVKYALDYLIKRHDDGQTNQIMVSPDGGSLKKIYKITEKIGFTGQILTCSKFRDIDGKLTKTHVPLSTNDIDKDLIIIDDICDGGRTFNNIAIAIQQIRTLSNDIHPSQYGKIYLVVTHGIFSAGFDELSKYFDGVFCTNSVSDINQETVKLKNGNKFELIQLNII